MILIFSIYYLIFGTIVEFKNCHRLKNLMNLKTEVQSEMPKVVYFLGRVYTYHEILVMLKISIFIDRYREGKNR